MRPKAKSIEISMTVTGITDYNPDKQRIPDCRVRQIAYFCLASVEGYSGKRLGKLFGRSKQSAARAMSGICITDTQANQAVKLYREWFEKGKERRRDPLIIKNGNQWKAA